MLVTARLEKFVWVMLILGEATTKRKSNATQHGKCIANCEMRRKSENEALTEYLRCQLFEKITFRSFGSISGVL